MTQSPLRAEVEPRETPAPVEVSRADARSGQIADWRKREVGLALRNAGKLGGSLALTWGIALVARLYLPRFLGPERFGMLSFAEAFTTAAFVVLGLGLDTYVRKEVSVRPEHASDFIGGVVVLRMFMALLVFGGMELLLHATHRSDEIRDLVRIYGVAQLLVIGSTTSAGLLHAKGNVNEMSVLSVVTKLVWGAGIALAIFLKLGLWAYGLALVVSEGIKSSVLFALARRHLKMQFRVDARATKAVIVAALPFYVSAVASTIYNRIDMSILSVRAGDHEAGLYGAASGLAGLTMLLSPMISWVMLPLFARAAAVSQDELVSMARRALELILVLTVPVALLMALGADVWIRLVFGAAFEPASLALQVLAPNFVVMYVSIVCWSALTMLNRTWATTSISVGGLLVNPLLNQLLIGPGLSLVGAGGGGAACALAAVLTEFCVVSPMLWLLGRRIVDARLLTRVGKSLVAAGLVVGIDRLIAPSFGALRLAVDALAYAGLALGSGAVDARELVTGVRNMLRAR